MDLPFQHLAPLGATNRLVASRGPELHVWDAASTMVSLLKWRHPRAAPATTTAAIATETPTRLKESLQDTATPPSKRRKTDGGSSDAQVKEDVEKTDEGGEGTVEECAAIEGKEEEKEDKLSRKQKIKQNRVQGREHKKKQKQYNIPAVEAPLVVLLSATSDGSHVVAVTGSDKTVWVFAVGEKGQLSKVGYERPMPKRPSALAVSSDNETIYVADKFGDVYALPLIPSSSSERDLGTTDDSTQIPVEKQEDQESPKRLGANEFTVHTGRNRRALENQLKQFENGGKKLKKNSTNNGTNPNATSNGQPSFQYELLLGHVSMLSAIHLAQDPDKPARKYIITADRDEHIRLSRAIKGQTHIIESYCLGHQSFVSALCLPRPDLLISGGGDSDLFIWDWRQDLLLARVPLLDHVKEIPSCENHFKVAVSGLWSCGVAGETMVLIICECVPALLIFKLDNSHSAPVLEPHPPKCFEGNPLDLAILPASPSLPELTIVVSVDPHQQGMSWKGSLYQPTLYALHYNRQSRTWPQRSEFGFPEGVGDSSTWTDEQKWQRNRNQPVLGREHELPQEALERLCPERSRILYPVECLRKTEMGARGDEEGEDGTEMGMEVEAEVEACAEVGNEEGQVGTLDGEGLSKVEPEEDVVVDR